MKTIKPKSAVNYQNEWHELRISVLQAESWLSGEIKYFLSPFQLTQKQFNILRILRGHQEEIPLSILDIRIKMIDKMSDASRIIDRLAKKGLVEKIPCKMDKRTMRIKITEDGLLTLTQVDQSLPRLDAVMNQLTPTEARQLCHLLQKMVKR